MVDPLPHLARLKKGYKKLDKVKKNHIKLLLVIFTVSVGLIFYFFPEGNVSARTPDVEIALTSEVIDPLHRIGQGIEDEQAKNFSENGILEQKEIPENPKFIEMLEGFPMEKMIPALNRRSLQVSSYLIAIAKKESDWGKYSPKKRGKECYNFWGYKGPQNQTDSGYSCFDSPEDAIAVVGDRIENLLDKKIDTPEKLVVWKCGASCAGHNPTDVQKWILDVANYYRKLNS